MDVTAYQLAQRFVGLREVDGPTANDQILAMLRLDDDWPHDDVVPWCSAFMNYTSWLLRLPRSKSLRARSWLTIGEPVDLGGAEIGYDVVILKRSGSNQPGPDVINAKGHVGWYAGLQGSKILLLGGNQNNQVSVASYPKSRLLGIRRLV